MAEGQAALAIILGCADSRVSPEIVFDQGVGDLFVVRVAGNMVGSGPILKGSIEFAVAEFGARVIMVLGHSACGACKAAIAQIDNKVVMPGLMVFVKIRRHCQDCSLHLTGRQIALFQQLAPLPLVKQTTAWLISLHLPRQSNAQFSVR